MKPLIFKNKKVTVEWRGITITRLQQIGGKKENFVIGNVFFQKLISIQ